MVEKKTGLISIRSVEKKYWNKRIENKTPILKFNPDDFERKYLNPCFIGNGDYDSDERYFFHRIINGEYKNKYVLDYACGNGTMAIYYAMKGARKVVGFDFNKVAIDKGMQTVRAMKLKDKVSLFHMDASSLKFENEEFDIVIGHGALHHCIKYENIFENLYRVMKPNSSAYFLENLADFFLWKIRWYLRGQLPQGDVPIFSRDIIQRTRMFKKVEILGMTFINGLKAIIKPKGSKTEMTNLKRNILRITYRLDEQLFNNFPFLRKFGSRSVIILKK